MVESWPVHAFYIWECIAPCKALLTNDCVDWSQLRHIWIKDSLTLLNKDNKEVSLHLSVIIQTLSLWLRKWRQSTARCLDPKKRVISFRFKIRGFGLNGPKWHISSYKIYLEYLFYQDNPTVFYSLDFPPLERIRLCHGQKRAKTGKNGRKRAKTGKNGQNWAKTVFVIYYACQHIWPT